MRIYVIRSVFIFEESYFPSVLISPEFLLTRVSEIKSLTYFVGNDLNILLQLGAR